MSDASALRELGEQNADERTTCLEDRRERFRVVVRLLQSGTAAAVDQAADLVSGLSLADRRAAIDDRGDARADEARVATR